MKNTHIELIEDYSELEENEYYLLTREAEMADHTGIYKYSNNFNHGNFVLYSEYLKCYYKLPFIHNDIKIYRFVKDN